MRSRRSGPFPSVWAAVHWPSVRSMQKRAMTHILVTEDDRSTRKLLRLVLERQDDVWVTETTTTAGAIGLLATAPFDLLITDLVLPGPDGFELISAVRHHSSIPILVISNRGDVAERVRALRLGADDFLGSPFNHAELIARVHALLRRSRQTTTSSPAMVSAGRLSIDLRRQCARVDGARTVHLTPTEVRLLTSLADASGAVRTRAELAQALWGPAPAASASAINTYIADLRRKLEPGQVQSSPAADGTRPGLPPINLSLLGLALLAPGVVVHELSHWLLCRLSGVSVRRVVLFQLGSPAGYVSHAAPRLLRQHVAIASGPLLVSTSLATGLFYLAATLCSTRPGIWGLAASAVSAWLAWSIALEAWPSLGDARALRLSALWQLRGWNPAAALVLLLAARPDDRQRLPCPPRTLAFRRHAAFRWRSACRSAPLSFPDSIAAT